MSAVPSPASTNQSQPDDDKEYMEKLKQLQKYIEPLSRMINKVKFAVFVYFCKFVTFISFALVAFFVHI